jgi:hypothetical protein
MIIDISGFGKHPTQAGRNQIPPILLHGGSKYGSSSAATIVIDSKMR